MIRIVPKINSRNAFFYIGLMLGIFSFLRFESRMDIPSMIAKPIYYISVFCLTIQVFSVVKRYKVMELLYMLVFLIVCMIAGSNSKNFQLMLITGLSIIAAKGESFEEIARCYLCVGASFLLFHAIFSSLGLIPNSFVGEHDADQIAEVSSMSLSSGNQRNCFGYGWPTNFANHLFFVLLSAWVFAAKKMKLWKLVILLFCFTVFVMVYLDSRLSALCILGLAFSSMFIHYFASPKIIQYKIIDFFLVLSVPIVCFLSYYVTSKYDPSSLNWIVADFMVNGRLSLGNGALYDPGLSIWGQFFIMYSGEFTGGLYNYVDNSFVQSLVINGLVYTSMLCFLFTKAVYQTLKSQNYYVLLGILLALFSGIIAQHFIQLYMNVMLLACTAKIEKGQIPILSKSFTKKKKVRRQIQPI